jgi:hypothetical protein
VSELQSAGYRVPPVLITECGIDGGAVTPEREGDKRPGIGWQGFCDQEAYLRQLEWYDSELRKDSIVVAATPFVCGPNADWASFELTQGMALIIGSWHAAIEAPGPLPEPLPNDEQGPPAILAQKARWWCEEMQRQFEAGSLERAEAIRLSLIDLLYRLERGLQ